ncbi:MAG: hypothetical protein IJK62_08185 [Bacteroidales bacterium]|nr:hypothetical protein [Bacteroidales bacterium]
MILILLLVAAAAVYILFFRRYYIYGSEVKGLLAKCREQREMRQASIVEEEQFAKLQEQYRPQERQNVHSKSKDAQNEEFIDDSPKASIGDKQVVINRSVGKNPLAVIKVIMDNKPLFTEIDRNAGLIEVKNFVDSCKGAVVFVTRHVDYDTAHRVWELLTEAGANAEVWNRRS